MTLLTKLRRAASFASLPALLPFIGRKPESVASFALNAYSIRPLQVPDEFTSLAKAVADLQPRAVLEIGTARGGSLLMLCRLAHPEAVIISIDMPGGYGYRSFQVPFLKLFPTRGQRLCLLKADSHDPSTLAKVKTLCPQNLDFLFIDGDHSYQGVRADFEMYSRLMRPGGTVVFHDICDHRDKTCEVPRFWHEIKSIYPHREIIADPEQGWGGIGLLCYQS